MLVTTVLLSTVDVKLVTLRSEKVNINPDDDLQDWAETTVKLK